MEHRFKTGEHYLLNLYNASAVHLQALVPGV